MSDWSVELFHCHKAPIACLWSLCVPCGMPCMQATTAKIVVPEEDAAVKACLFAVFLCCFGAGLNRTEIRKNLSINGSYVEDCLLSCFLPCCSVVQEWREVMRAKSKHEDEYVWRVYSDYNAV